MVRKLTELADGRRRLMAMFPNELPRLIIEGEPREGDEIEVFGVTVQLVINPHIPSGTLGKYSIAALTRDDDKSLKIIRYDVKDGEVTKISKTNCNEYTAQGMTYEKMYKGLIDV